MSQSVTGRTGLICLLGHPVAHTISPSMHNTAFALLGLDYLYMAFDVGSDTLKTAVEGLRALGARGFNLTMPDKQLMCEYCDRLSEASLLTGAVNTVVNDQGILTGYTTDGIGYMKAVAEDGFACQGKVMTMLGCGGAGGAILVQASLDGMKEIRVFNRKSARFKELEAFAARVSQKTGCRVTVSDLEDRKALYDSIGSSHILTNTTNVGMGELEGQCLIEDPLVLRPDLFVSDIIYKPDKTRLLEMAEARGCATSNGLYMLLYQGAEAFRLWTGQEMPVEVIREKYFRRQS